MQRQPILTNVINGKLKLSIEEQTRMIKAPTMCMYIIICSWPLLWFSCSGLLLNAEFEVRLKKKTFRLIVLPCFYAS